MRSILGAMVLAGASASGAWADMGVLLPLLPQGVAHDAPWSTATAPSGAFAIGNLDESGSIRYYYLNTAPGHDKLASVRIEVVDGDPKGFAGILFSFEDDSRHYHVFAVHGDGSYAIYKRDAGGFNTVMSTTMDQPVDGEMELSIEEKGDEIAFSVNGTRLGSVGSDGIGEGAIGIAVGGIVSATFSDFKLEDASF